MNILKTSLAKPILAGILIGICLLGVIMPKATNADFDNLTDASYVAKISAPKVAKTLKVVMTAYSSTPDQTDDTPFVTASGKSVGDGVAANNMLPFGTKIRIPKLYGEKIFVVQDRMNKRMGNYRMDIWMPDRSSALKFGVKSVQIEILENQI